jgi:hypothetical protein
LLHTLDDAMAPLVTGDPHGEPTAHPAEMSFHDSTARPGPVAAGE